MPKGKEGSYEKDTKHGISIVYASKWHGYGKC